jgi:hypothetical protein
MSRLDWTFGTTWPTSPDGSTPLTGGLHYVDEGPRDAPQVVMVHGNPTWAKTVPVPSH